MITPQDLVIVGFLVFLEGILSIDNALVLAMLARHLPPEQRKKALTYGLVGAVFFRLIALSLTTYLLRWTWVKFVGGGYLVFIALKHFLKGEADPHAPKSAAKVGFWHTVILIELTDIAFAVDSILAAVALSNKFWVVFTGGFLGVVAMRFAATQFIKLLDRFPGFETTAYLLVLLIGLKVILEGLRLPGIDFHSPSHVAFWVFWAMMAICIALGFRKGVGSKKPHGELSGPGTLEVEFPASQPEDTGRKA
jgi:YkoY family integral membrane protein